jgi:transcriptional regulator with XRE-family HTH domain
MSSPEEEAKRVKRILGARISRRRDKLGLNQEELAHLAKVDRSHMTSN